MTQTPQAEAVATSTLSVRVPDELLDEIERVRRELEARLPAGVEVSRTDVVREALKRGLPLLLAQSDDIPDE